MDKVLCIGHAAYDITMVVDRYPLENNKYRASNRVACGGGAASNTAYLLGSWGVNTFFTGIVGNDLYGQNIKKELESVNVNTKYLQFTKEYPTSSSFIVVNQRNASRTIFTYHNPLMRVMDMDINEDIKYIYMDGSELDLSLKVLNKYPEAITILDADKTKYANIKLAKMAKYLIASRSFTEDYVGISIDINRKDTLISAFKALKRDFTGNIVITLGEYGCLYEEGNEIKLMPTLKLASKDTTGAGDFFRGAFIYCLINGYSYVEALKIANITGAASTIKVGNRFSVPTKEEVLSLYEKCR